MLLARPGRKRPGLEVARVKAKIGKLEINSL